MIYPELECPSLWLHGFYKYITLHKKYRTLLKYINLSKVQTDNMALGRGSQISNLLNNLETAIYSNFNGSLQALTSQAISSYLDSQFKIQPSAVSKTSATKERANTFQKSGHLELSPISKNKVKDIVTYLKTQSLVPNEDPHSNQKINFTEAKETKNIAYYGIDQVLSCPHIINLANDPKVIAIIERFLGTVPTLINPAIWWSFSNKSSKAGPQNFHEDRDDIHFCKLFLYLTDVTMLSGPHVFFEKTNRFDILQSKSETETDFQEWFFNEKNKSESRISKFFNCPPKYFVGQAGTRFLVHTAGLHKGLLPKSQDRLVCQFTYGITPRTLIAFKPKTLSSLNKNIINLAQARKISFSYINRLFLKDEIKFQNNEPISHEYINKIQDRLNVATTLSVIELAKLLSDLKRVSAPVYNLNLIEGLISQKNGNYKHACNKLFQAYSESGEWPIFNDFLNCFLETIGAVNGKSKYDVIGLIVRFIKAFIHKMDPPKRQNEIQNAEANIIRLSSIIGKILCNSDEPLQRKQKIAKTWLDVVQGRGLNAILKNVMQPESLPIDMLTFRFLGHLLACVGYEKQVIQLNSSLNTYIKTLEERDLQFKNGNNFDTEKIIPRADMGIGYSSSHTFQMYLYQPGFSASPNIFCEQLLTTSHYDEVLDVGCGPGRIAKNLEGRYNAIDGLDINPNHLKYAEAQKIYRELFLGDANVMLEQLSKTYDLIILCMILDYLPGKDTLKLAAKRLKPNGHIALTFLPSDTSSENSHFSITYYEPQFYSKLLPEFSVKKSVFKPYLWSGGYYVLLSR